MRRDSRKGKSCSNSLEKVFFDNYELQIRFESSNLFEERIEYFYGFFGIEYIFEKYLILLIFIV